MLEAVLRDDTELPSDMLLPSVMLLPVLADPLDELPRLLDATEDDPVEVEPAWELLVVLPVTAELLLDPE